MTKYNFDGAIERKGTYSAKWECMNLISPHTNEETLPMWVADMDFSCPPEVLDALHKRVDNQIFGYSMADDNYYLSVQSWFRRRFNWEVEKKDIVITSGILPALENLVEAFSEPEDGIIIQPPVYHKFADIINQKRRTIVNNPLIDNEGYYTIDFADLELKASDPNNKIMMFCSPHNPVGRVWSEDELRRVGEICLANNVLLISDEIHFDLVRQGVIHTPLATLFPDDNRIITCTAPSKTFNMAGLHISNIIIRNEDHKKRWNEIAGFGLPSPLGLAAATAAYEHGEEWLEALKLYLDNNFQFAKEYLDEHLPQLGFIVPNGTYFIWLNMRRLGLSDKELDNKFIKEANVLPEGGTMFGEQGSGYQRLNIACPRSTLEEGLNRIVRAFK
ncbi:MalY/PatB family protein [Vibrio sp. HN007]|uniref:MalY/PatB family protein n=1 Tax=Vibrio iocasae TaxID=3098914 RepID=UPI0035D48068